LLNGQDVENEVYPKQIAFNVIPHIDVFQDKFSLNVSSCRAVEDYNVDRQGVEVQ
jgi:hypothetical protein